MRTIFFFCFLLVTGVALAQLTSSAFLKEEQSEAKDTSEVITINYRTRHDLLILPAIINDTVKVNLILDPRCKTLILFGKKYEKKINRAKKHMVNSSGMEHHKIKIGPSIRENIPIVVVRNLDPMNFFTSVNGVIGADVLAEYELEFNHKSQIMTMKPLDDERVSARLFDPGIDNPLPYNFEKIYTMPMLYKAIGRVSEK